MEIIVALLLLCTGLAVSLLVLRSRRSNIKRIRQRVHRLPIPNNHSSRFLSLEADAQPQNSDNSVDKKVLTSELKNEVNLANDDESPAHLEQDYGYAVLQIATLRIRNNDAEKYLLLFALLELIPKEIPRQIQTTLPNRKKLPGSRGKQERNIFIQRIALSISDALSWYLNCMRGECVIPIPEHRVMVEVHHLSPEPAWPFMTCVDHDSFIPFQAAWHIYPRLHQLISLSFSIEVLIEKKILTEDQVKVVHEFLRDRLHFDIAHYPSLWGSVNLLAPNPIFREFSFKLQEENPAGDIIKYGFIPRAGRSLNGLIIVLEEEKPCGKIMYVQEVSAASGEFSIPYNLGMNRVKIVHRTYGLLFAQGLARFIRSFSFQQTFSVATREVEIGGDKITVPLIKGASADIEQSRGDNNPVENPNNLFRPVHLSAIAKLHQERARHEAHRRSISSIQQSFYRNHEGALNEVRRRISLARSQLLIVDPYFSSKDLELIRIVGDLSVQIRILTSANLLRVNPTKNKSGGPVDPKEQFGYRLQEELSSYQREQYMNPIEIRVLEGDDSPVHDRFLCVDDTIHLIGNSLNSLGENYSVLLTSPDSKPIELELEEFWERAIPLHVWVTNSQKIVSFSSSAPVSELRE